MGDTTLRLSKRAQHLHVGRPLPVRRVRAALSSASRRRRARSPSSSSRSPSCKRAPSSFYSTRSSPLWAVFPSTLRIPSTCNTSGTHSRGEYVAAWVGARPQYAPRHRRTRNKSICSHTMLSHFIIICVCSLSCSWLLPLLPSDRRTHESPLQAAQPRRDLRRRD